MVRLILLLFCGLLAHPLLAQQFVDSTFQLPTRTLVVATKPVAPFVIHHPNGTWSGISVALWEDIARELNLRYEWQEMDLAQMTDALADSSIDVAVAALSITEDREARFDFTHPYYTTGLAIATRTTQKSGWGVMKRLFSPQFWQVVGVLILLLLLVGALVWLFERRRNADQFERGWRGIGSGFWWSAVTMTTVGYGDKAPSTWGGRIVALVWMFVALIVISSFTAALTSALTLQELEGSIKGRADLPDVRVGAVANSTGAAYLERERIGFQQLPTPAAGLQALHEDRLDAFVYDDAVLRYEVTQRGDDVLQVLPERFGLQYYGIGLPSGSPLREPVNRVLLDKVSESAWRDVLFRYLGSEE
ncbi:Ligand-gated ion channel [Catalinimonas alkaloidigena]|uniref:Ligand-gated ion channel n=1 Tax=Catalinimonas alkaloidigena TaxID=1075417 RepID=A0A1G9NFG3_9BACT|nr:transporter substrate-binding domain-containing protein [Catalinimonas alkaloidigena]SDL85298.1 Ligand-gated ion channel [Catalinimonas alkaloidigena]